MRHIRVLICQVDDGTPNLMSELACFDLATPDVVSLQPETALDALEAATQEIGTTILRRGWRGALCPRGFRGPEEHALSKRLVKLSRRRAIYCEKGEPSGPLLQGWAGRTAPWIT